MRTQRNLSCGDHRGGGRGDLTTPSIQEVFREEIEECMVEEQLPIDHDKVDLMVANVWTIPVCVT